MSVQALRPRPDQHERVNARLFLGFAQRRAGHGCVDRLDVTAELQPETHLAMETEQHAGTRAVDHEG
jgi:hypothetical protein